MNAHQPLDLGTDSPDRGHDILDLTIPFCPLSSTPRLHLGFPVSSEDIRSSLLQPAIARLVRPLRQWLWLLMTRQRQARQLRFPRRLRRRLAGGRRSEPGGRAGRHRHGEYVRVVHDIDRHVGRHAWLEALLLVVHEDDGVVGHDVLHGLRVDAHLLHDALEPRPAP
jgi:hypothetical protein